MLLWILFSSLFIQVNANTSYSCPTNVTCFEKETCCQTNTGLWACCPIESAVCCSDGIHCCPKDNKCLPNGNCTSTNNTIISAFPIKQKLTTISCPDGSSCPANNTCCPLSNGAYGCCPLPDAVPCNDHIHCCPNGYQCDMENSQCKKKPTQVNDVPCPGGSSACPDGNTCCLLESGDYGCCPLADAVCCSDYIHCCPHGYECDVEKGQCLQGISIPWFSKQPVIHRKQRMELLNKRNELNFYQIEIKSGENNQIICPDATSLCPSTSSCCLTPQLTYGCCPIENAVCCADHVHCCPAHYKCDLHVFKCDHSIANSIPLLKKEQAVEKLSKQIQLVANQQQQLSTIQCPDEKSYCPEETTCCQLESGDYGCCPYPDGSCCSDKIHCCGNGYSCDITGKRCIRSFNEFNETIPSKLKIRSFTSLKKNEDQLCPDNITKCSSKTTCCPNKDSNSVTYSCCPYAKGVCCGNNGSVCCPNNYQCDEKQLSCQLNGLNLARNLRLDIDFKQCGKSDFGCSNDQTCCPTFGSSDGDYACCTLRNAQCCEDGRHCCPEGTKCNTEHGGCVEDN